MRAITTGIALLMLWIGRLPLAGQVTANDPITVSAEHPRLFLRPQRLRLLRRERERTSMRWQQFETLIAGNAPMPEPGFALALYYQVSGNAEAGKQAIAWASGNAASDLRQLALVFDWCQDLLTEEQRKQLSAKVEKRMSETGADQSVAASRSRVLAAIALYDHVPDTPQKELQAVARDWWLGKIVPALRNGASVIARDDSYPLMELLHAFRDNTLLDLREAAPRYFKDFPIEHLLSYYPAVYEGPDTQYYIGAEREPVEPDLKVAALSRAAEMAMVAYDVNAPETQVLQGWLMHDRFILRSTFGAPYEFLWANPYQPGLSYYHVPLVYHNPDTGRLFVRSSWDDSAKWFGDFDGVMQLFEDGHVAPINPQRTPVAMSLKEAVIWFGAAGQKVSLNLDEEQAVFIVGLAPRHLYQVEIDDEEMFEAPADPGGILELLNVPHGKETGIRFREAPAASSR